MRFGRFLARLRPHAVKLGLAGGLLAVSGVVPGLAVWTSRAALSAMGDGDRAGAARLAAGLVGLALAQGAALVVRTAITRDVSTSVASELRRELHAALVARRGPPAVGDQLSALTDEVDAVQYGVSGLVTAVRNPITIAVLLGSAVALAPALAVPAFAVMVAALAVGALASRRVRQATEAARRARAAMSALAAEQLGAAEVIRVHGAQSDEQRRFRERDDADRAARRSLEVARVVPAASVELIAACGVGLVLVLGASADHTVDPPTMLAFVAAIALVGRPLAGLAEVGGLIQRSLAALDRVDAAIAAVPVACPGAPVPDGPLTLSWRAVTVRRGGRAIVDRASLCARPGELTALVGPTGAGKTTLLRLAWGGIDPDEGSVHVGDVSVADVDPSALGAAIAVVPQDGALFARSIAENVALGDPDPDRDRVCTALDAAAAGFAVGGPGGVDRVLAERADGLSGGERQRIAIARALYRGARILLLDEPTASLDAATAGAIVGCLREACAAPGARVVVVATHDPRVIAACDRVYRVDDGRVHAEPTAGEGGWTASSGR